MSTWDWLLEESGPQGDADACLEAATALQAIGRDHLAASALDRAFGLRPDDATLRTQRAAVLESLSITAMGLYFRYVPAGTFLMGSHRGEADEQPVHPRLLPAFWMAEVPLSWSAFCRLLGWSAPPEGAPPDPGILDHKERFDLYEGSKIRHRYCRSGESGLQQYDEKPLVVVSTDSADALASHISGEPGRFFLPSEAQWEKAARGGLIGARYAWGDAHPTPECCDFGQFETYTIRPSRDLPPNGYGLYSMCGGVWEWTSDVYDAHAYGAGRTDAAATERVLRGGSWADCAEAVTVSYRMSSRIWFSPTIGMRLAADFTNCRPEASVPTARCPTARCPTAR